MYTFIFSLPFFASFCIYIATGAFAGSDSLYRDSSGKELTTRQAAGSVPASEFVRRAFQGCKYWEDPRFIGLPVTYCDQLLS